MGGPRSRHGHHAEPAATRRPRRRQGADLHRANHHGAEAKEIGLVTHVVDDPYAAASELAREIAGKSPPHAVQAAKRLYEETWTGSDPASALLLESRLQVELMGSPNQIEAVTAGKAGRAPVFVDPD